MRTEQRPTATTQPQEQVSLEKSLFSAAASWLAVPQRPIVAGQLDLVQAPTHGLVMRWTPSNSSRVNASAPSLIELKVPASEIDSQSIWDFKAAIGTNFLASGAHTAKEPLRTPFFQALIDKGFTVTALQNTCLTDANISLALAPKVNITDVKFNACLELKCDELNMTNVTIEGCKITFDVSSGQWKNSKVTGDTTHLLGRIGSTVIAGDVFFVDCFIDCDMKQARLTGHDLRAQFLCKCEDQKVPPSVLEFMTQMTDEQAALMWQQLRSATWSSIELGQFVEVADRTAPGRGSGTVRGRV